MGRARAGARSSGLLLPDFMIIGRPKSGTTSLARWLAEHPDVFFCRVKEPRFFFDQGNWHRGLDWYSNLFKGASEGQLLGEATPGYTHPDRAGVVAERIARIVPDVRLVYLLRHPIDRLRSEYRHRRMMRAEARSFEDAVASPDNLYALHSMYHLCLSPYIEHFAREQILVVRLEDLVDDTMSGWEAVLDHLGLSRRPRPEEAHNVSEARGVARGPLKALRSKELRMRLLWVPDPLRRAGKRLLRQRNAEFAQILEDSKTPVSPRLFDSVWTDIGKLERWLGVERSLWAREPGADAGR